MFNEAVKLPSPVAGREQLLVPGLGEPTIVYAEHTPAFLLGAWQVARSQERGCVIRLQ